MAVILRWLKTSLLTLVLVTLSLGLSAARWNDFSFENSVLISALPAGNAITQGEAILRYALPIDNDEVRKIQGSLEDIADRLRGSRWGSISRDVSQARRILQTKRDRLLASVPDDRQAQGNTLIDAIEAKLPEIDEAVEAHDKEAVWSKRREALALVGDLEQLMVAGFPFEVPEDYSHLPQLKGRATVELKTNKGDMTIVVDGYNAPVTAGNFIDLVQRGFYDGLDFIRAEDAYIVQTGDPAGPDEGFIDPKTGEYRAIPLEIKVEGDEMPVYEFTLESIGRYLDQPVLPFSALGALAVARPSDDPNGGSSQVFFLLYDPEVTPAGRNLLDGRYAVFGYVTENEELLKQLGAGDKIESARVVEGAENLIQPA